MQESWGDSVLGLYRLKQFWVNKQTQSTWVEKPFLRNTNRSVIVDSHFNHARLIAGWILFSEVSVEAWAADAVWQRATFRYQVWFQDRYREAPVLLLEEFVVKEHPGGTVGLKSLAVEIDKILVESDCVYIRDTRLLQEKQLSSYATWRKFLRPKV